MRVTAAVVLFLGGVVACTKVTGGDQFITKDCQGCLQTLCATAIDTCNTDRACANALTCLQMHCPDTPGSNECTAFCMAQAISAPTEKTADAITAVRACGFRNCMSCASPPVGVPEGAAPVDAARVDAPPDG